MAKHYVSTLNNPITYYLDKNKLTKSDLCKMLGITRITLNKWIESPRNITLSDILLMAGLFNVAPEQLFYLLVRNKPKIKKDHIRYLDSVMLKVDE